MARMVVLQLAAVRLSKATNSVIILPNSVPVDQFKLSAIWTAIYILITVRPNPTHRHTNTPTPTHPGKYIWATSRLRRKLKLGMESLHSQTCSISYLASNQLVSKNAVTSFDISKLRSCWQVKCQVNWELKLVL